MRKEGNVRNVPKMTMKNPISNKVKEGSLKNLKSKKGPGVRRGSRVF